MSINEEVVGSPVAVSMSTPTTKLVDHNHPLYIHPSDTQGCVLISIQLQVSQFTLYGILKGNKPDFHVAMPPEKAKPFYASLVEKFQKAYKQDAVKDGIFGAMMKVNLVNDGPVTMHLDSAQPSK
uniref:D-aminoacyl-tRNA deacylase n=1 Tax=Nicotiana tabacum TaxID=4097 RepID=A0A1S3ZA76_TOBAC|nr:PREDICTED: D-tyrosyl-tRNA(Tyr) deacylase 1-like isoform X2 [Nicotiana tabacum]